MKNKLWSLYKTSIFNNYNVRRSFNKKNKTSTINGIVLSVIIYIAFMLLSSIYSFSAYYLLKGNGLEKYLPLIFYMVTLVMTFMLTVNKAKSTIFDSRYNDTLFSMPIKAKTILTSRVLTLLTMNYITTISLMLPALIVFGILSSMGVMYYLIALIVVIFTPMLPVTLAALVGYVIALISSKIKGFKKIAELILTFGFFIIFMGCYSFASKLFGMVLANISSIESAIDKYGLVLKYITNAIVYQDVLSLLKFVGFNLILFIILIWVLSIGYLKISSNLLDNGSRKNKSKKKISYKKSSILGSLTKRELKNMFAIPTYIFNSLFGVVLFLIAAIATFFVSKDNILGMVSSVEGIDFSGYVSLAVIGITLFIVSMSNTTCSSISLEGKSFWIIKSLPVKSKIVLDSKILTNIITVSLPTLVAILIMCFNFKLSIIETLLICVVAVLLNIVVSELGILVNLAFPKLNYESEIQVIKQSTSTFICVFSMMIFAMIVIAITAIISFTIGTTLALFILMAFLLIIAFCERLLLNGVGVRKFEKISD